MIRYRVPAYRQPWARMAQAPPPATRVAPGPMAGVPGVIETLAVLGVSAAAAWVGVRAGLRERGLPKYAGWVGGLGSALIGLLYLGSRTGFSGPLPGVRFTMPEGA